jgi:hypothetical protein
MDGTRLSVNPPSDRAFSRRVHELARDASTPEDLELTLRRDYPLVRVVRGVTDIVDHWYVYREGRWVRPADEETRYPDEA